MNPLTTGTLLQDWGNKERDFGGTFDLAQLFTTIAVTGTDGTVPGGAAWQPGRYGYVRSTGFSDPDAAKVMAHEIGHNFNGDHGRPRQAQRHLPGPRHLVLARPRVEPLARRRVHPLWDHEPRLRLEGGAGLRDRQHQQHVEQLLLRAQLQRQYVGQRTWGSGTRDSGSDTNRGTS